MKINVGIDLGTTYSAVSTFDKVKGTPVVLKNSLNNDFTPSVINIQNGTITIGQDAKDMQGMGDQNTAAFYKTFMGDNNFKMNIDGQDYTSEDLSGLYLQELKKDIERKNNIEIGGAVITVPAYFNEAQRQATINAGKRAGLNVLKIINEPTAAIIAYGLTGGADKTVMVYDLGGGTFDVTIAAVQGSSVSVLGTNGDHQLGGKDWDFVVLNYLQEEFLNEYDIDIKEYPDDYNQLQVEVENAKKKLSQLEKTTVSVACNGCVGRYEITREWFNDATSDLLNRTQLLTEQCFKELGDQFSWSTIDEIVLVGGSTRMPQIREFVTRMIGKPPVTSVNVDTIVSCGAAIQAVISTEKTVTLSLGKAAPSTNGAPAQKKTLTLGANSIKDVTSHSLGLLSVAEDGSRYVNTIIIPKNEHIPSTQSRPFKIRSRKSSEMQIDAYILQGESEFPRDNHILGQYIITGMDEQPEKEIVIDIQYTYDENGMVVITAVQRKTGKNLVVTKMEARGDTSWMDGAPAKQVESVPTTIYIALDVSGSMSGSSINAAEKAALKLCSGLDLTSTKVSLVLFANKHHMACYPSHNMKEISDCIKKACAFKYNYEKDLGWGTNGPLGYINNSLSDSALNSEKHFIVLLTDGEFFNANDEINNSTKLKNRGVEIITIGIEGADKNFLKKLATSDEGSMMANINQLQEAFSNIAQAITEGSGKIKLG